MPTNNELKESMNRMFKATPEEMREFMRPQASPSPAPDTALISEAVPHLSLPRADEITLYDKDGQCVYMIHSRRDELYHAQPFCDAVNDQIRKILAEREAEIRRDERRKIGDELDDVVLHYSDNAVDIVAALEDYIEKLRGGE